MKYLYTLPLLIVLILIFYQCKFNSGERSNSKIDSLVINDSIIRMKNRIKEIIEKYPNSLHHYKVAFDDKNIIIEIKTSDWIEILTIDTIPIKLIKIAITEEKIAAD